jgi:CubicO group peptidase (beta-lactamase class C family)
VQKLLDQASRDVDGGRLPSCQLALARYGELVEVAAFGDATVDSRYVVFSVTKALTAALAWQVISEGLLSDGTRVAELVPQFDAPGKRDVTLEHLLTHTAGFPNAPIRWSDGATAEGRAARFAQWRLDWEPGSRTVYHSVAAHWVVADLVEKATGTDYRAALRQRVLEPLGLPRLQLGVPEGEQGDITTLHLVGEGGEPDRPVPVKVEAATTLQFNRPEVREVGVPGAGAVATAADIALFYQALLAGRPDVWDPAVLADATSRIRFPHLDPFTNVPANRTLGLTVAGSDGKAVLREFGKDTSARAFGASGLGGQIAWADPATGLSFCYLTNGMDSDVVASFLRSSRLSTLAARCGNAREADLS